MEHRSLNIHKSHICKTGFDFTTKFETSMKQQHAQLHNIVASYINHLLDEQVPQKMLKWKIIKKREDINVEKWKEYALKVTAEQIGKLEVYSNELLSRKEVNELDKKLTMKKERMEAVVGQVLEAMNELVENRTGLELEREERKYKASLREEQKKMKIPPLPSKKQLEEEQEHNRKIDACLAELDCIEKQNSMRYKGYLRKFFSK